MINTVMKDKPLLRDPGGRGDKPEMLQNQCVLTDGCETDSSSNATDQCKFGVTQLYPLPYHNNVQIITSFP